MKLHIHWFNRKNKSEDLFKLDFKQCRCGALKLIDSNKIYKKTTDNFLEQGI